MSFKAIFLDRDGVINKDFGYVFKIEDFVFTKGALSAMKYLIDLNYVLFIITNQSGIGRGYFTENDFLKLDSYIKKILKKHGIIIKETFYCPHHPEAKIEKYKQECSCRKPKTGMLDRAFSKYEIDKSSSFLIGDKLTDIEAGKSAKIKSLLFNTDDLDSFIRSSIIS